MPAFAVSSAETELKLALPGADAARIAAQVAAIAALAGVPTTQQRLRNLYFDTPEQHLRQHKAALRLRSLKEGDARPRWLQTLKTAGEAGGALTRRGEWESPVRSGRLDALALQATPWPGMDPRGELFGQLGPVFETQATRTLRTVQGEGGSRIEVALDVGQVIAGEQRTPLCELELELLQGAPDALFALAEQVAHELAVLPATLSKAERGWRLLDGTTHAPRRARKPALEARTPVVHAAQAVLAEALAQFTENLGGVLTSDGAELVHQARVGWRRWRSALWLFKPLLAGHPPPDVGPLRPLLNALGATRDLDVAALESLPPWADAFIADNAERAAERATDWQAMEAAVLAERRIRRAGLLSVLQLPATGLALVRMERWVHGLPAAALPEDVARQPVAQWALTRATRLHKRLAGEVRQMHKADLHTDEGLAHQHNVRLLAKRTRYVLEALRTVLPKQRTRRWADEATGLQTRIGASRDLLLLATLLEPLGVDRGILGFLRGVSAARMAQDD
ncbi:MAG: CHAD domain-containing protein [Pseudomonadota bacterium]|nr:CHAD domain-containing protein [Pseudomonadota bacterium]